MEGSEWHSDPGRFRESIRKVLNMRPKFWYCPFCGYMFIDTGGSEAVKNCPMCGEECMPCWECTRSIQKVTQQFRKSLKKLPEIVATACMKNQKNLPPSV